MGRLSITSSSAQTIAASLLLLRTKSIAFFNNISQTGQTKGIETLEFCEEGAKIL